MPKPGSFPRMLRRASTRRARRGGAGGGIPQPAAFGKRRQRRRAGRTLRRRNRDFHNPGLPLPRGRSAADQFPPAALHIIHAGRGLRRLGAHESGLCPCGNAGLPLLLLWRRLPASPGARKVSLEFTLLAEDGSARRGRITTAHGPVDAPAFMPVGTSATVKAMRPGDAAAAGVSMILAHTYHLMLRPGAE